jgi:hypothetical protein
VNGMRMTTIVSTAASVGLAFCGVCVAQSQSPTPPTPSVPSTQKGTEPVRAQATVLTGRVTSVDAKAGTLTVKTKDKEVKLTTASASTKSALAKLKVGDTARVFERGGQVIAASPAETKSSSTVLK